MIAWQQQTQTMILALISNITMIFASLLLFFLNPWGGFYLAYFLFILLPVLSLAVVTIVLGWTLQKRFPSNRSKTALLFSTLNLLFFLTYSFYKGVTAIWGGH